MFYSIVVALSKEKGTNISNVISELQLSSGNLSKWKAGGMPKADTLSKLADYFDVSTDYLLGRTDNPRPIEETARLPHMPQHIAELTLGEVQVALAYRAADERARQMVDLALEPWKKSNKPDEAM